MNDMQDLRLAVSALDASIKELDSDDYTVRLDAILDAAALLSAAKRVVLND